MVPLDSAAIESLKERIARDPLSRAFLQLAEEYRRLGRYQDAVQVCLDGLARHPAYHTARISLGRTYMEAGNLEAARRSLSEVLELAPENHLAGKLLADVQRRIGDVAGAAETYRSILRYYPADREVGALLQNLLKTQPPATRSSDPALEYRSEDIQRASPGNVRPAVDSVPRSAPAELGPPQDDDALQTNTLAELYLRQGLVDRAVEVYRAMLRVDPGNHKARRRLQELTPATGAPAPPGPAALPDRLPAAIPERAHPALAATVRPATAPSKPAASAGIDRLERWLQSIRAGSGREAST